MNIALFGGTFDPVHLGHLQVAKTVLECLSINQVWFVPSGNPPHKSNAMFDFEKRIFFLKEVIKENPAFFVWEKDIRKHDKSYTIYLIKELTSLYPDYNFSFIIGADNVCKLKTWKDYQELLRLINFIVIDRNTEDKSEWENLDYYEQLRFVNMPLINISSSDLRKKILAKEDVNKYLPIAINKYF